MWISPAPGTIGNNRIPRREYHGIPHSYNLTCVTDLGGHLIAEGAGAYTGAADVSRSYHQLRPDPRPCPLYCITFEDSTYVDLAVPFWLRILECLDSLPMWPPYPHLHGRLLWRLTGFEAFITLAATLGLRCLNHHHYPLGRRLPGPRLVCASRCQSRCLHPLRGLKASVYIIESDACMTVLL